MLVTADRQLALLNTQQRQAFCTPDVAIFSDAPEDAHYQAPVVPQRMGKFPSKLMSIACWLSARGIASKLFSLSFSEFHEIAISVPFNHSVCIAFMVFAFIVFTAIFLFALAISSYFFLYVLRLISRSTILH